MVLKLNQSSSLSTLLIFSLFFHLSLSNPDSTALLAFKLSSDTSNFLSTWSNSSDICSWLGVTCDPMTHRVTKLVLNHLNLTGSIHALTRLTHLRHLSLQHNYLSSVANLASCPNLKHLYLSHNRFAGDFPAGIPRLLRLRRLDLSFNRFSGEIPFTELTHLPHLLTLRLEFNSLTGTLNSTVSPSAPAATYLSEFNISGNNLVGKIPNWLSKFPATSFSGNAHLCGNPLPSDCPKPTVGVDSVQIRASDSNRKRLSNKLAVMIVSVDVIAVMTTLVLVTCCCYRRRYKYIYSERKKDGSHEGGGGNGIRYGVGRERNEEEEEEEMVYFEGCKGFAKVDELLKASAEMLGKGGVGTTYKVVMDGGNVVVVKRVRERRRRRGKTRREVGGLMREIGGLRHPNIVSLRAYYCSSDELLFVSDFLPNGSLHSLLHGNRGPGRTPLDWSTRLKLASGSAQGLAFLHSYGNKSKLFHGHLTTSNILVDHHNNACISDIGLHRLLINRNTNTNHSTKFSQKSDVYSFGMVLLEILTGKAVASEGEESLVKWVRRVVEGEWRWEEVFDFELLSYKEMRGEMVAVLQAALLCLTPSPKDRPKMSVVCKMIEDIRGGGGEGGGGERTS